jgi:membrane protein YdbS with pleckstrin-like domain
VDAALWAIAITAGRLTAYSAYVISRTVGAVAVALVVAVVAFLVARLLVTRRGHEETVNETLPSSLAVSLKGK